MVNHTQRPETIVATVLFKEFLEHLVDLGYSTTVEDLVEGVFQRAFFEEWMEFLTIKKTGGARKSVLGYIKEEFLE